MKKDAASIYPVNWARAPTSNEAGIRGPAMILLAYWGTGGTPYAGSTPRIRACLPAMHNVIAKNAVGSCKLQVVKVQIACADGRAGWFWTLVPGPHAARGHSTRTLVPRNRNKCRVVTAGQATCLKEKEEEKEKSSRPPSPFARTLRHIILDCLVNIELCCVLIAFL